MPFEHCWESRGVVITYSGTLMAEDVLECHRQIAGDPRFDDLRYAIVDTLPVQSVSFSRPEVEEIDAFLRGPAWTNPNIQVVIVATVPAVLRVLSYYDVIADRSYKALVCPSAELARQMVVGKTVEPRRGDSESGTI